MRGQALGACLLPWQQLLYFSAGRIGRVRLSHAPYFQPRRPPPLSVTSLRVALVIKGVLDGYIARTWPTQKSALGSALDPLADKILISVLYVSLTFAQLIPAPLTALVIFRDVGLIAAVFWVRYKTVPPPVRNAVKHEGSAAYCKYFNTAIQLCLVAASLAAPVFQYTDSILLQCLWYVTAVTTAASGYSYWHYGRKTVQLLNARSP
uniref:cardiolipin synthase (CMP-forming) n=1 Tax=Cyprinodon variegatus TaxID=28743 RepID=A0A3Q2CQX4_CYPVA